MRQVSENEISSEFEREYCLGDDQRHFYSSNRRRASVFGYFLRINCILDMVEKYCKGNRVADLASAQGNIGLQLAEKGYDVTAVDIKPEFLTYAKKKYTHGKFKTELANIIDYRNPSLFDAAVLGEVIEHVAFPDQLLKSVNANLKIGGILVLSTPNGNEFGNKLPTYKQVTNVEELIPRQFHWGNHLFLYTDSELKEILEATGFEVLEVRKLNSQFVSQMKFVRYLLPYTVLRWLEVKTRDLKKGNKETTNNIVVAAKKVRS